MSWGSVRGHDRQVEELRRCAAQGRLPHALLLIGPEGIGKRLFARRLAQALLCDQSSQQSLEPCGRCPACVQVEGHTHPDLLEAARPADKHELPIQVVRDLCHELALKPMHGTRRVAIVDDADDMSEEAANAFLKSLEEPPMGSVLILVATASEGMLETVVSRCRVMRFEPVSQEDLSAVLLEQGVVANAQEAERLGGLGEGSVRRALGLADGEIARFRRDLIDELARGRLSDPGALAQGLEAFVKEAGKESALHRERARLLVGELAGFFRAVLWQSVGMSPPGADPADRKAAASLGQALEPEDVMRLAERCLQADYEIHRRAYLPVILESLVSDLDRLLQ